MKAIFFLRRLIEICPRNKKDSHDFYWFGKGMVRMPNDRGFVDGFREERSSYY